MALTMKDIKPILADLKTRKPPAVSLDSDKPLSNKQAVMLLATQLAKMKERGFTTAGLVEILKEHHIDIRGRDLSRYLREFKGEKPVVAELVQQKHAPVKIADSMEDHKG
jgi:hypothetical protein